MKRLVNEVLLWLLAGLVTLGAIGGVNVTIGIKPINEATIISWAIFMISAFLIRSIFGFKGTAIGKEDTNFKNWVKRLAQNLSIIREKLTYKKKKDFCIDATKREREQKKDYLLKKWNIDDYFFNAGTQNKKNYKEWIKKQKELGIIQKYVLKRVVFGKFNYRVHNVNKLNTNATKDYSRVYDLKDYTASVRRRDTVIWLISASIVFLAISSIIVNGSQSLISAIIQSLIILISLSWNAFNSYVKHIGYIVNEKVQYLQRHDNFVIDAGKFNNVKMITTTKVEKDEKVFEQDKSNGLENS